MKRSLNQNKPGSGTLERDYSRVEVYDDHVYKKIIPSRDRAVPLTKEWFKTYQGNFISYYNKKIYESSIKKNLKDIENKQKDEEDFFNNIGN